MDLVREFLGEPLDLGALIFSPPLGDAEEPLDFLALPVLAHSSGFLLAIPPGTFSEELLTLGQQGDAEVQVGPSFATSVAGLEEDEAGIMQEVAAQVPCLVVDLKEEMASYLRKMDPVTDPVESRPFLAGHPSVVPQHLALVEASRAWLASETGERLAFYSASEEPAPRRPQPPARAKRITTTQLASQIVGISEALPLLTAQLQSLAERQESLEKRLAAPPRHQQRHISKGLSCLVRNACTWGLSGPPSSSSRALCGPGRRASSCSRSRGPCRKVLPSLTHSRSGWRMPFCSKARLSPFWWGTWQKVGSIRRLLVMGPLLVHVAP